MKKLLVYGMLALALAAYGCDVRDAIFDAKEEIVDPVPVKPEVEEPEEPEEPEGPEAGEPVFTVSPSANQEVAHHITGFEFTVTSDATWACYVNETKQDEGTGDKVVSITFPANTGLTSVAIPVRFTTTNLVADELAEQEIEHLITITQKAEAFYAITLTDNEPYDVTLSSTVNGQPAETAKAGADVTISATVDHDPDLDFFFFQGWDIITEGLVISIDLTQPVTSFTMPEGAVEFRARFAPRQEWLDALAMDISFEWDADRSTPITPVYNGTSLPEGGTVQVATLFGKSLSSPGSFTIPDFYFTQDGSSFTLPVEDFPTIWEMGQSLDVSYTLTLDEVASNRQLKEDIPYTGIAANKVGMPYWVDGVFTGVVYQVRTEDGMTSETEGLIVHKDEGTLLKWGPIGNVGSKQWDNGSYNQGIIQGKENWETNYPAFRWCVDQGAGWFLPALSEWRAAKPDTWTAINTTLTNNGGTYIEIGQWYWSSYEMNTNYTYSVRFNASTSTLEEKSAMPKGDELRVRAVKAF